MGNVLSPCLQLQNSIINSSSTKLIFYGGTTKTLTGKKKYKAGEIMFEFPDKIVCHADSFFIGRPIPALSTHDVLLTGQTYFILPLDLFPPSGHPLSVSSLASLQLMDTNNSSPISTGDPKRSPIKFGDKNPFDYIKGPNGRVLIKVVPEFIIKLISGGNDEISPSSYNSLLCSTPELKKHYDQLVGSKDQVWSPKLETISEYKIRYSPCRFLGLEWKEKEKSYCSAG